jgi:hypothetical protein
VSYGAGAPLFNIHSQNNHIDTLVIEGFILDNLYFTANMSYPKPDVALPCFFTTEFTVSDTFTNVPTIIKLVNFKAYNIQFDGVTAYIGLLAEQVTVNTLFMMSVGHADMALSQPRTADVVARDRSKLQTFQYQSFIRVVLFTKRLTNIINEFVADI